METPFPGEVGAQSKKPGHRPFASYYVFLFLFELLFIDLAPRIPLLQNIEGCFILSGSI